MLSIHRKYVEEELDERGYIKNYRLVCPDHFNFAYDIVDEIASYEPERKALMWCDPAGNEKVFTYGELKYYSDKTANLFKSKGIGKGDMVMAILKRHYQFWFVILALHKLGSVVIPATFLLTAHDFVYRANAAGVKAVVCTGQGNVAAQIDEALPECPTVRMKMMVNGSRDGWEDFMTLMEAADSNFPRVETKAAEPMLLYFSSGRPATPKWRCTITGMRWRT